MNKKELESILNTKLPKRINNHKIILVNKENLKKIAKKFGINILITKR